MFLRTYIPDPLCYTRVLYQTVRVSDLQPGTLLEDLGPYVSFDGHDWFVPGYHLNFENDLPAQHDPHLLSVLRYVDRLCGVLIQKTLWHPSDPDKTWRLGSVIVHDFLSPMRRVSRALTVGRHYVKASDDRIKVRYLRFDPIAPATKPPKLPRAINIPVYRGTNQRVHLALQMLPVLQTYTYRLLLHRYQNPESWSHLIIRSNQYLYLRAAMSRELHPIQCTAEGWVVGLRGAGYRVGKMPAQLTPVSDPYLAVEMALVYLYGSRYQGIAPKIPKDEEIWNGTPVE